MISDQGLDFPSRPASEAHFSKAPETFRARKDIFIWLYQKNGEA